MSIDSSRGGGMVEESWAGEEVGGGFGEEGSWLSEGTSSF